MKSKLFVAALALLCVSGPAMAKTVVRKTVTTTAAPATTTAYENRGLTTDAGGNSKWIGVASDSTITRSQTPSLSALLVLGNNLSAQLYAGISSVNPFNFGVGGNLKLAVVGDSLKGFHVGGGIGLGTSGGSTTTVAGVTVTTGSNFYVNVNGIVGFQFEIVDAVMVNVDSGLSLQVTGGTVDVSLGGFSNMLGASVLFRI